MSEYSQIFEAREYLINNVLLPLHPNIQPLPTLIGVCTQVDNATTEITRLRAETARLRGAGSMARSILAQYLSAGYNSLGPSPEDMDKAFWALEAALEATDEH
jgi:hypothetical protein